MRVFDLNREQLAGIFLFGDLLKFDQPDLDPNFDITKNGISAYDRDMLYNYILFAKREVPPYDRTIPWKEYITNTYRDDITIYRPWTAKIQIPDYVGFVQFNTLEFLQGLITAAQWFGFDPHYASPYVFQGNTEMVFN